jgi:probable rRNA maturation factor
MTIEIEVVKQRLECMIEDPDPSDELVATKQTKIAEAEIMVLLQDSGWHLLGFDVETLCRETVGSALSAAEADDRAVEVSIVLADDQLVRCLNRDNLGQDRPTNVLAFPGDSLGGELPQGAPCLLGDVVLSRTTIAREANEQGKPIADHLRHLIVHGSLHLLGYTHDTEDDARAMELLEKNVLARMGVPNPYASDGPNTGDAT